jgi:N-acyl amino acid synthase of PEP-CTERM/exosortase system
MEGKQTNIEDILVKESTYFAKVVDPSTTAEYSNCLRLRHSFFCLERGWVPDTGTEQESDRYDPYCQHLAVFHHHNTYQDHKHQTLLAYMRLLPWNHQTGFMLEHDFKPLLTPQQRQSIIHTNSAELSRLVIAPEARQCDFSHTLLCETEPVAPGGSIMPEERATTSRSASNGTNRDQFSPHVMELLFKLMYQVSQHMGITCYYIVAEPTLLWILRRRFCLHFQSVGKPYTFPDGTQTQAAVAAIEDIEAELAAKDPRKLEWYREYCSA